MQCEVQKRYDITKEEIKKDKRKRDAVRNKRKRDEEKDQKAQKETDKIRRQTGGGILEILKFKER